MKLKNKVKPKVEDHFLEPKAMYLEGSRMRMGPGGFKAFQVNFSPYQNLSRKGTWKESPICCTNARTAPVSLFAFSEISPTFHLFLTTSLILLPSRERCLLYLLMLIHSDTHLLCVHPKCYRQPSCV